MQQLSPQDAVFAYMESPNTPLQLGSLNIYDPSTAPGGQVRFKDILRHVERRLHTVRFFREKLVFVPGNLDEPYWVDDEAFDLEYHVRHAALPAPGDWRQLCILTARLFARPFDFAKPLWEFFVIEGLDNVEGFPKGSFALLAKMHHAAIDGVSGVDVTTSLHSESPEIDDRPVPEWTPKAAPQPAGLLVRAYVNRMARPGRTIQTIARTVPAFRKVKEAIDAGDVQRPVRHKVPETRFAGPVGPHRVFEALRFTIDEIKQVRALVPGATINDVLLAIVGGALRRYLEDKRELPDEPLLAACPVSLRAPEERGVLGNRIGQVTISLATDVGDPRERLRRIYEETKNANDMNEAIGAKTLTEISQLAPGALMGLGMRVGARASRAGVVNTTVTNVPGPQAPLYLGGARVVTQFGIGTLMNGMGLVHFVHSYCGEITLSIIADRDKLPDPEFYAECLHASYDELAHTGPPRGNPGLVKRRTRRKVPELRP
jgi:WS/DGAT/MGAT family acyltransferase